MKKFRLTLCVCGLAAVLAGGAWAIGGGDSLISLSYLTSTFLPEAQTQMEEEGKALVTYRFQDGEIEVRMIQPGLSQGSDVWLPELM